MNHLACLLLFVLTSGTLAGAAELMSDLTVEEQQRFEEARNLSARAVELNSQGRPGEAVPLGRQALAIFEEVLGLKHRNTVAAINNLGVFLNSLGDYEAGRPYLEQALAIREEVCGEKHADTAQSLFDLGSTLFSMEDYQTARGYLERSLAIREEVLGENHAATAMSLNNLGELLKTVEDYAAARPYLERALAIRRKVLGEKHIETAGSLNNLGDLLNSLGDDRAARPYHEQALAIYKEVCGDKHPNTAISLNNLGLSLQGLEEFTAARSCFEQSLAIREVVYGKNHLATARVLNNLGWLLFELGDYGAARPHLEQALAIRRKVRGDKHADTVQSLSNLGNLLTMMGDYAKARPCLEQALAIDAEIFGKKSPEYAADLNNLGVLLDSKGDFAAARSYYEQALAIYREVRGEEDPDTAELLNNLGCLLQVIGEYDAAQEYHQQALAIRKESVGKVQRATARSVNNLGGVSELRGDYAAAIKYYTQAVATRKELLGENHPETALSLSNLSAAEAASGQWEAAATHRDQARRIVRRHVARVLPRLSASEQATFLLANDEGPFHAALSLGLLRATDPRLVSLSSDWLLNGKAVAQEALAQGALLARQSGDPAVAAMLKELLKVRTQLAALPFSAPTPGQAPVRRKELEQLEGREEGLARRIAEANGQAFQGDPWVGAAAVQRALTTDAVLVDVVRFNIRDFSARNPENRWQPARYAAWIIPPIGQRSPKIIDLGEADRIDQAAQEVGRTLQAAGGNQGAIRRQGEPDAEGVLRKQLEHLAKLVLIPIVHEIGGVKQLILSPDAALWLVPWGALPLADGRYAVEQYQIRYVVSGRDLVAQRTSKLEIGRPAIMADPDYDLSPTAAQAATRAVLRGREVSGADELRSIGPTSLSSPLPKVPRLRYTGAEAELISPKLRSYTDQTPELYTDKDALEGVFKAFQRPQVMVVSTHGFFFEDQLAKHDDRLLASTEMRRVALTVDGKPIENPLLRCGLLLAGCNQCVEARTAGVDDGVLTGMEIVGTDLRGTELVVLSACETGLGQIRNGEGVAGLRQAFQLAGAQAVVATLWQVSDRESARLMTTFFENLAAGQSKADALRNAQLKMIEYRREKHGAAHPFYWAAFTITGE